MTLTIPFTNHTFVTGHTIAFGSVQINVDDYGHPDIVIWDDANGGFAWPIVNPVTIDHTPEPDHVFIRDHGPYKGLSRDLVALGVIETPVSTLTFGALDDRALHARLSDKVLSELETSLVSEPENIAAVMDEIFQDMMESYQLLMGIPGLPQGLIQEATREFEAASESVEQCHRKLAAKKSQSRENDDELNNSTH